MHGTATVPFGKGRRKNISFDKLISYMNPEDLFLPEVKVEPLGDLMLDFLIERDNESEYVDFKEIIDISRDGPFAKIAKDIFAFSNYGGGFILIGFKERKNEPRVNEGTTERPKRTFLQVGLPEDFHIDQASLQEKFNAYSNSPIELGYREFWRKIDGVQKKFAAIYVQGSQLVLQPVKRGIYEDSRGKTKIAFDQGTVLIRRGTQSIVASDSDLAWIKERSQNTGYSLSVLTGKPDYMEETLFSNLFRIIKFPASIWSADEVELDGAKTIENDGDFQSFVPWNGKIVSFCNLLEINEAFSLRISKESIKKEDVQSWVQDPDRRRVIIWLLNNELSLHVGKIGLSEEPSKHKFFYSCAEESRKEAWKSRFRASSEKTVAQRIWAEQLHSFVYWHIAVNARFTSLYNKIYLRLIPTIQITEDGRNAIFGEKEGTIITRLTHNKYNADYLNSVLFWIQKLANGNDVLSLSNDLIIVSTDPVEVDIGVGIRADVPPTESSLKAEGLNSDINVMTQSTKLRSIYIEEPDLVFGGKREEKDPKIGLRYLGPYQYSSEVNPTPSEVKVGIIGSSVSINLTKQILQRLGEPIESSEGNKWLYPDYPGFRDDTSIRCNFITSSNWELALKEVELRSVLSIADDVNKRIAAGVNLFKDKVKALSMEDNRPDVIICTMPSDIEEYCGISEKTRGAKRPKFTPEEKLISELKSKGNKFLDEWGLEVQEPMERDLDLDFHNALKGKIMEFGIPIQLLRESTARGFLDYGNPSVKRIQEPATFSYNFATALYYKANGKPWRLAKLRQDTCYVGISFYHNLLSPKLDVETSMAQVFTHNGEGMVLRGTDVVIDQRTREAHMSQKQAYELMKEALKSYEERAGRQPSRVVIHKKTSFYDVEREGFMGAIGNQSHDFVAITDRHSYRFARTGQYPVLRGTSICLSERRWLLYTSGYIPRVRTYPGHRIPSPLLLNHQGDSQINEICEEILGLTKLNWNTTSFATLWPITLEFSKDVGKVLSELPEGSPIQNHYRFYM